MIPVMDATESKALVPKVPDSAEALGISSSAIEQLILKHLYFHNEMLSKVDRMTMACSVEGRAPFAAPAVQGMASRLSWDKLIRDGQLKWVLRKAFSDVLPADVVSRPKHGFNVPIDHWLNDEWRDLFVETFADASPLVQNGILRRGAGDYAERLLADPRKLAGHALFTFVMLHLWMSTIEH